MDIYNKILKYRIPIFVIVILIVCITAFGLFKLNLTVSIDDYFMKDDPVNERQDEYKKLFGNNDFIGVLVESNDIFSRESLELIHKIGIELQENVPFAMSLNSIAADSDSLLSQTGFEFDGNKLLTSDAEIDKIKKRYKNTPSLGIKLFSEDCKQAWVLLSLDKYPDNDEDYQFNTGEIAWRTVQKIDSGESRITATGVPVYAFRKQAEIMENLIKILIIGFIAALTMSILIIKNTQGVIGALSVIASSVIIVFGLEGFLGTKIDTAFIAVPILLCTGVSIGYTVHISRFYKLNRQSGKKHYESIIFALQKSGKPILFTAFTTIVALLSFMFVQIRPIKWVGITSACCILAAFLTSMLLFPIILSFRNKNEKAVKRIRKTDFFNPMLTSFARIVIKHHKLLFFIFLATAAISIVGASKLEVDFNAEKMIGTKLPHMKDQMHVNNSEIAVSDSLDFVIKLKPEAAKDPETLNKLSELEKKIKEISIIKKTTSVSSIITGFNYFSHNYEQSANTIPETKAKLRGLITYLNRLSPTLLNAWVTKDFSSMRIFIELSDFSSKEIEKAIIEINNNAEDIFGSNVDTYFSGSTYQMALMNQYVTRGLIHSILISLILISCLMIIVFRSLKIGLAAMIPNIFPVLAAGGVMGFLHIPLEFVTMTVAPMIIGLAVDDTIHLLFHLKNEITSKSEYNEAVKTTFQSVGSAITETTIILCVTFLVFTASKVNSIVNMGIISCTGMLSAYLADIFITPVIVRMLKFSGKKQTTQL
ncbi:MAG: MMPL family transporter [Spirochaetales bacterium]|nr:MMPL family transporter [Spirochaetales bacterium]